MTFCGNSSCRAVNSVVCFASFSLMILFADVAVTGLPEPQERHAIIMAKFARDCLETMYRVTQQLEVTLGPDSK